LCLRIRGWNLRYRDLQWWLMKIVFMPDFRDVIQFLSKLWVEVADWLAQDQI
jgi:hypothetical protein